MPFEAHSIPQLNLGGKHPSVPFRQTPAGQPTVADLLAPCDTIISNYSSIQYVIRGVYEFEWNGLKHWSLSLAIPGETKASAGINELVAVDGKVLKLFGNNRDEIYRLETRPLVNKNGQLALFA